MHRKIICAALAAALTLSFTAGCSAEQEKSSSEAAESISAEINERFIDDIKARGYLVAGCKTDVPGLSLYDSEKDSWSGLETDIAYRTAGLIFGVSPQKAREENLVHFIGVKVADREEILESGEADCLLATYTITDERKEKYALSDSYYTSYIGIMVRDYPEDNDSLGSSGIDSIADLDGKYIGVPLNSTTRKDFLYYLDMMNTIKVTPVFCEYEGYEILHKALLDGNIDAFAVDESILKGYDDDKVKILSERFGAQHYGAAVLKKNIRLMEYLNDAISE